LLVEQPLLWVALRSTAGDPPYMLAGATVDPAEGESWVALGTDLVDSVLMPGAVEAVVADFVSEHYVEQPFHKRKRDRADPEGMARRLPEGHRHIVIAAARGGIISDKTLDVQASVGAAVEKRGHRTRNKADPYLVGFVPNQN
jgi:hypothetical protein